MSVPENLLYTKDHEWISLEGDVATVGITQFAADALGDMWSLSPCPRCGGFRSSHGGRGRGGGIDEVRG